MADNSLFHQTSMKELMEELEVYKREQTELSEMLKFFEEKSQKTSELEKSLLR